MLYNEQLVANATRILEGLPTSFEPGSFDHCRAALLAYAIKGNPDVTPSMIQATFDGMEAYRVTLNKA